MLELTLGPETLIGDGTHRVHDHREVFMSSIIRTPWIMASKVVPKNDFQRTSSEYNFTP
jgi:hypothetical protein